MNHPNTELVRYSSPHCTVGIRKPDMSGFRMVDLSSVFEWSGFRMVEKQDGRQTISLDRFIYKNIFSLYIKWSSLINHSKTDLQNVRFSNESGFRMVGFRIPTVFISQIVVNSQKLV